MSHIEDMKPKLNNLLTEEEPTNMDWGATSVDVDWGAPVAASKNDELVLSWDDDDDKG